MSFIPHFIKKRNHKISINDVVWNYIYEKDNGPEMYIDQYIDDISSDMSHDLLYSVRYALADALYHCFPELNKKQVLEGGSYTTQEQDVGHIIYAILEKYLNKYRSRISQK